ncbi:hypothetical protein [Deinococcus cellulosilyticus]|uniref:Uncharacterized protein n=1 Tax=Deinococcus cellulosilyticus (strain DSM 18568 / NBRC 106333 / KACC 11606 / 5516J-15) TaxID=1223518 RepID=A0A511NAP4_DEIC1|nr:hypothetical protein [Deinococcus cellulosilyticus]GEM49647.1 hypothetical protein DC3_52820 [Deinococcus cellulosilyticus NBRC 106333 = KACC 11606]
MPREPMLTTHDLKERGWTSSMIRKLLPEHDDSRENLLDRKYGEVKLYLESRVLDAESTAVFAELLEGAIGAQERGSKARQTRLQKIEAGIQQLVERFGPQHLSEPISPEEVQRLLDQEGNARLPIWQHHMMDVDRYEYEHNHLGRLSRKQRSDLQHQLDAKARTFLSGLYPSVFKEESSTDVSAT